MTAHICPECRNGKHVNCVGTAWDDDLDVAVDCECTHVTVVRTRPSWKQALLLPPLLFSGVYAVPLLGWFVGAWTLWFILAVAAFWTVAALREDVRRARVERVRAAETEATIRYIRSLPVEYVATQLGRMECER